MTGFSETAYVYLLSLNTFYDEWALRELCPVCSDQLASLHLLCCVIARATTISVYQIVATLDAVSGSTSPVYSESYTVVHLNVRRAAQLQLHYAPVCGVPSAAEMHTEHV